MDRHRATSISSGRSRSSASKVKGSAQLEIGNSFEPCTATASMFLYATGRTVVCHHHDTLAIDKKFERHLEDILLLSADNVSDTPGRLVVSYDVGLTAIIWDLFTGDEVSRFASYDTIRVCSWLRNGNLAFGNSSGEVIFFDSSSSEHGSVRTIYDPITAIAPSSDCRTYALGYMNGSILIATLHPNFTIRHTLTTSRAPEPIVSLAWHGSARGQRTDMLATQTRDGDLRIWSIAKDSRQDAAKIVRILKRSENYTIGPNWLAWSKNGKIVQFSEGSTALWDVRTKNVSYEMIPTNTDVCGIAVHGPNASLFVLGRDSLVQQYELNPPSLAASVYFNPPSSHRPQSPAEQGRDVSDPRNRKAHVPGRESGKSKYGSRVDDGRDSTAVDQIEREMAKVEKRREQRQMAMSTTSSVAPSQTASTTSRSSVGSRFYGNGSITSKAETGEGITVFSQTSSIHTGRPTRTPPSVASSQRSAQSRGSRLRNEVLRSPDVATPKTLFHRTTARLSDVPYRNPSHDQSTLTPADLRMQMLSVVFGWNGDIDTLIRDEQVNHTKGSLNSIMLSKWLGDEDSEIMENLGTDPNSSNDWMIMALSTFNGSESSKKTGQTFVRRLLSKNDINSAVTILLGLGDQDDAVEVYVSHKHYMEAVLLTALIFSDHWQRISELLRKWGEHAVSRGQNQLAIRCFACTGQEPTGDWTSPRAQKATFDQEMQSMIVSNTTSPGGSGSGPVTSPASSGTGRMPRKGGALKLITSFDNPVRTRTVVRDDSATPVPIAHTPIDTAITPGGFRSFGDLRSKTPLGHAGRARMASIGENPAEATPETTIRAQVPMFPEINQNRSSQTSSDLPLRNSHEASASLEERFYSATPQGPLTGGSSTSAQEQQSRSRGVSRDRKPDALNLQPHSDQISRPASRSRHHRSNTESYVASPPVTGKSFASVSSIRSPLKTGRTIDEYINSLNDSNFTPLSSKTQTLEPLARGRNEKKSGSRNPSQSRGRSANRYASSGKRSPTSPVPMSPDDAHFAPHSSLDDRFSSTSDARKQRVASSRSRAASKSRPETRPASRQQARRMSPESRPASRQQARRLSPESRPASRATSRMGTRNQSRRRHSPSMSEPRSRTDYYSTQLDSSQRSPSSPVPMSPHTAADGRTEEDEDEDERRYMEEMRKRYRARHRSASRKTREQSTDPPRARSTTRKAKESGSVVRHEVYTEQFENRTRRDRAESITSAKSLASMRSASHRQGGLDSTRSKELAARELEDRRKSLAQKSSASLFPYPNELLRANDQEYASPGSNRDLALLRSKTVSPLSMSRNTNGSSGMSTLSIGLPATPRAMRHPKDADSDIPSVPGIPSNLVERVNMSGIESDDRNGEEAFDTLAPLPSSTYTPPKMTPKRAASAPPEEVIPPQGLPQHPAPLQNTTYDPWAGYENAGQGKKPGKHRSLEHATDSHDPKMDNHYQEEEQPVQILPELLHLSQSTYQQPPPPPPPPPMHPQGLGNSGNPGLGVGVISIAIDGDDPSVEIVPQSSTPAPLVLGANSQNQSHRGRGQQESFGTKIRDRMRSASRSRNKSPPGTRDHGHAAAPYESVAPPPMPSEKDISQYKASQGIERHPREVRAQLTPEMAKLGFTEGGMI